MSLFFESVWATNADMTDVPSHAYQLSFESWPDWSDFYANAPEILKYWKLVAKKYDVTKHIRFRHKCIEARWNEQACKWTVKIEDLDTGLTLEDSADVLMTGTGTLNDWKWPDIPNLHQFEGPLLHSANWDEGFDPTVSFCLGTTATSAEEVLIW